MAGSTYLFRRVHSTSSSSATVFSWTSASVILVGQRVVDSLFVGLEPHTPSGVL